MPRPASKKNLLSLSDSNFLKLRNFIDSLPANVQEREFPKGTMNRKIRDVLCHLYHWHQMVKEWYEVGMRGEKPDIPGKGYTWKTVPDLNRWIFDKYQETSLLESLELLSQSHQELMNIIKSHTDEELFEKKRYKWTGSTSLGAYLISATSSHYEWAFKLIKKATR